MATLARLEKYRNVGLLILRLGIGGFIVLHGWPKLIGGTEVWTRVGGAMTHLGIHDYPAAWGFMAAVAEVVGGALFAVGFLFRPTCLFLIITMAVAGIKHIGGGDGIGEASHAFELLAVFAGMVFVGPGRHSLDKR